ncbi:MAG: hypothetical protein M1544_03260, partial [Candidatus Marsarchaeota archaeon]|nr:hypothetical protein [Candidatus Marsarchaeota archaeon]
NNTNSTIVHVGARARINPKVYSRLRLSTPNVTITNASLSEVGNSTKLSVTVKNNGNSSVYLNHILVYGIMEMNMNGNLTHITPQQVPSYDQGEGSEQISSIINQYSDSGENLSSMFNTLASKYGVKVSSGFSAGLSAALNSHNLSEVLQRISSTGLNVSSFIPNNTTAFNKEFGLNVSSSEFNSIRSNLHNGVNLSIMDSEDNFNFSNPRLKAIMRDANEFDGTYHNMLAFIIGTNGTLSLPFDAERAEGPLGYSLAPGASETFTYNNAITLGNGKIAIMPVANESYSIRVIGEAGAFAEANVSAS